ncbi:uncharacterized protein LOC128857465 [Anastrepha ludens]|uniref:uncharacterized protein LOC128857465 n=1 Tax=Anastrepha ludens TaxID=28586 RepID=UPI0023B00422|nr:uncharacterized protein LOC128857465 [Anastrepha ludens]
METLELTEEDGNGKKDSNYSYLALNVMLNEVLVDIVQSSLAYKLVKLECLPNARYIRNATCAIKAVNRYRSLANMECDIVDRLQNVSLNLEIFQRNTANHFKPFLVNVTTNVCKIFDRQSFDAYATIVAKILKDVSNVNHTCPYMNHLIVKNLLLEARYLPIVPPLGFYKLVLHFLEGFPYDDVGSVILYVQITEVKEFKALTRVPKFRQL